MTQVSLQDRMYGALALAGIGDALGAPTEQWSIDEIAAAHGGLVTAFVAPSLDTFAGANGGRPGEVTDDASQMYYLARALVRADGPLDGAGWVACLLDWAAHSPKATFMGPSTAAIVQALRAGEDPALVGVIGTSRRKMTTVGITNGAAMRVAPVGLVHPGDLAGACEQALVTCLPSHDTDVAIASACALAAAAAVAVTGASLADVLAAAVEGGQRGERLGRSHARTVPGASFVARLDMALRIAAGAPDDKSLLRALEREVGTSVLAAESVPAALGVLAYAGAEPLRTVALCASIGNDTDSMATMAGALAGAMAGRASLPQGLLAQFTAVNGAEFDLAAMAAGLARLAARHGGAS